MHITEDSGNNNPNQDHLKPEGFCPERWSPKFRASIPRFSYFPFGGGPRSCIEEPLVLIEEIIIMATVLKKWKVTPEEDVHNIKFQPLVKLRAKCGIRIKLRETILIAIVQTIYFIIG
jgi:cytochrome P450